METNEEKSKTFTKEDTGDLEFIKNPKKLNKKIWELTLPALVELLLATLFGMVDMIMVGNVNTESLAAVGITNQPMLLALAVFQAANVGTTALVARFIGVDNRKMVNEVVKHTLILSLLSGILVIVLGFNFAEPVIKFMGAEPDVIPLAVTYMRWISLGGIFIALTMSISASLRGAGDTISPMKYNLTTNFLNIGLNYVMIYGKLGLPAMGVKGAAMATTISRGVATVMALALIFRPDSTISLKLKDKFTFDIDIVKRILKIGIPSGAEQLALRTGQIEFARTVAGLGTTVFAAHQIDVNVYGLAFAPSMAFSMAATTLVGQSLGAGRPDIAEECGLRTRRLGMILAVSIASLFLFFGRQIASIYSSDPEVIELAAKCLKIVAIMQPMQSTQFVLAGALRGAGDTRWPLYATCIGVWGVRVVLGKLFVKMGYGLVGAWLGQLCDQLFRSIFIYIRYKSGKWKEVKV